MILNNFTAILTAFSFIFLVDSYHAPLQRVQADNEKEFFQEAMVLFEEARKSEEPMLQADEETEPEETAEFEEETELEEECPPAVTTAKAFKSEGVRNWNGWRWTWYSERVLPGGALKIPGRHTDEDGFVCDEDGYIVLASEVLEMGTVIDTIFGRKGKVYDSGCNYDTIDVYVNW